MKRLFLVLFITAIIASFTTVVFSEEIKGCGLYKADKTTHVYHQPWCQKAQKMSPSYKILFTSAEEAKYAGYEPCDKCHPPEKD